MKRLAVLTITTLLLAGSIAGCAQDHTDGSASAGDVQELVQGGQGYSPEDPLPFGGTYLLDDGMQVTVGQPEDITVSGLSADNYDLSAGEPMGVSFQFVNKGPEETMTSGIFVEIVSGGQVAELILDPEAKRVFHSGLTGAYTEEQILEMPPLTLKMGKPYDFQVDFIAADPDDLLLAVADTIDRTLYFSNN